MFLKNTASQAIGAQMVSATDGSAFTGAVTVYVTGDSGTQAVGSVGSGACTHEGNGYHSYAPAQAETNYGHVAFTFIGTGAIPATVQVHPIDLANFRTALGMAAADMDTQLDGIVSSVSTVNGAVLALNNLSQAEAQTAAAAALTAYDPPTKAELDSGLAALNDVTAAEVVTALFGTTVETGETFVQLLRKVRAKQIGQLIINSDTEIVCRDKANTKDRLVFTVDSNGAYSLTSSDGD